MESGDTLLTLNEGGVASLLSSLGFPFYDSQIKEHGITGEVLVHLDHEALKDVGIHSVGQRLSILKAVYALKIQENLPIEEGHYVPPSDDIAVSLGDVSLGASIPPIHLLEMLGERDDRIRNLELEVQRLSDSVLALRDDIQVRASTKTRPLPARSPTGHLFPHPLSNASTLGRSSSRSRPIATAGEDPPPSPLDFSRLFVDSAEPSQRNEDASLDLLPLDDPMTPTGLLYSHQQEQQHQIQQSRMDEITSTPLTKSVSNDSSHYLRTSKIASTSTLLPVAPAVNLQRSLSTKAKINGAPATNDKSSLERSTSSADNPYRSFRVTLEDPCHKVLPAALKKYKINDDWRQYALFICYGNTERCLSYDEKPLLLFQRLKEASANPVFMLRHIKDIKSPIAVASAKHAARREKRSLNAGVGLDKPPSVNRDGSTLVTTTFIKGTTRLHQPSVLLPVGKGREKINAEEVEDESAKDGAGYCISIYPYLAERDDEFDVAVGDSFSIIRKTKGWWVVYRSSNPSPLAMSTGTINQSRKSAWVPAGCLLEINVSPLSLADPSISPPPANAAAIPILPIHVISVSTPGIALMDYVKNGADELAVVKGTALRILKRYNHWSYAIKEESGERGWLPSWYINKSPVRTDPVAPTTAIVGGPPQRETVTAGSGSSDDNNSSADSRPPLLELDGIATGLNENVFDVHF